MNGKKIFAYGDRVRVVAPGYKPFMGTVYSQESPRQGAERHIYVTTPSGSGVAYLVRYVTHAKPSRKRGAVRWRGQKLVTTEGTCLARFGAQSGSCGFGYTWSVLKATDRSLQGNASSPEAARQALTRIATSLGFEVEQPRVRT